jgi:DNA-binding transcriptional MerR regulator
VYILDEIRKMRRRAPDREEVCSLVEGQQALPDTPLFPDQGALGERIFLSADVARLAGVSLRQLQWWDERKLVSPRQDNHRRIYAPDQVLEILTVASLRRKRLSLQRIRRVLRLLRRGLGVRSNWSTKSRLYLITDGSSVFIEDQPEVVLTRLADATKPQYMVSLSDQMKRIASEKAPSRYRAQQMPLF